MKESTKSRNIRISSQVASELGLELTNNEYNYGRGIGKADNYCLYGGWLIAFEIEYGQSHPSTNVLKSWMFLDQELHERLFLVQILVPNPKKSISPNRINLCDFIASKIKTEHSKRFVYSRFTLDESKDVWLPELQERLKAIRS